MARKLSFFVQLKMPKHYYHKNILRRSKLIFAKSCCYSIWAKSSFWFNEILILFHSLSRRWWWWWCWCSQSHWLLPSLPIHCSPWWMILYVAFALRTLVDTLRKKLFRSLHYIIHTFQIFSDNMALVNISVSFSLSLYTYFYSFLSLSHSLSLSLHTHTHKQNFFLLLYFRLFASPLVWFCIPNIMLKEKRVEREREGK